MENLGKNFDGLVERTKDRYTRLRSVLGRQKDVSTDGQEDRQHHPQNEGISVRSSTNSGGKISRLVNRLKIWQRLGSAATKPPAETPVVLTPGVISELKDKVSTQRDAKAKGFQIKTNIANLDSNIDLLNRRVARLDFRAAEIGRQGDPSREADLNKMRRAIHMMRTTREELLEQRAGFVQEMSNIQEFIISAQEDLQAKLEECLIGSDVVGPSHETHAAISISHAFHDANGRLVASQSMNTQLEDTVGSLPGERIPAPRGELHRCHGSHDLHHLATCSANEDVDDVQSSEHVVDPKQEAERNYKLYKLFLDQAEANFENRRQAFEDERDQLLFRRHAGWAKNSVSQLDKRHILVTRKLAQRYAKAEEEFYAAKEEAIAAGVDFGSDAESGFLSRADDGYSMSMEVDGELFVDRNRIDKWLSKLPAFETNDLNGILSSEPGQSCDKSAPDITKASDDGDELRSVELSDTRSAIAEGPSRRRIDKWNSIREGRRRDFQ